MIETDLMHISPERDKNGNTITLRVHSTDSVVWDWLKKQSLGISKPIPGDEKNSKSKTRWITIHAEVTFFKRD